MKILTDDKALELTEQLLRNDKNIKEELESKIPNVDNFVTESYVVHAIASAQLSGGGSGNGGSNIDLSGFATKDDLNGYATKNHTHDQYLTEHQDLSGYAKKTDVPNLNGYATEGYVDEALKNVAVDLSDYYTKSEVDLAITNAQLEGGDVDLTGYATEEYVNTAIQNVSVDLTGYAKTEDIPDVSNFVEKEDGKGLFSGSYNDLSDKPTIPEEYDDSALVEMIEDVEAALDNKADKIELHTHTNKNVLDSITADKVTSWDAKATEAFVTNAIAQAQLDGSDVDLSGLATKDDLDEKADKTHTHVLTDITDYEALDLSGYALKTEIPSIDGLVTEEVLNTTLADYAKSVDVVEYDDTELIERINDVGTALIGKADKTEIPDVSNFVEKETGKGLFSGSYNDLTNKPTIPSIDGLVSEDVLNAMLADYAKTENLPDEYDDTAISNRVKTIEDDYVKSADIPTELPASDVYNWAKAATKPTYTASEVGALPSTTVIPSIDGLVTEDAMNIALADKVNKVNGKGLSTNDLTDDLKTSYDNAVIKAHTHTNTIALNSVSNEFDGKKILIVGDSIMYGFLWEGGFKNLIEEKYPSAMVLNNAVTGTTLSNNQIFTQIVSALDAGFVPDIILMDGGGNDMLQNFAMGKLKDNPSDFDITTVLGALETLFATLITNHPTIKTYFMGIYQLSQSSGDGANVPYYLEQLDWWNNIKSCCVKYGIPYIDMFSSGTINGANAGHVATYVIDNIHINEAGYRRLFPIIESAINGAPCSSIVSNVATNDPLAGKKILCLGDSLMYGNGWSGGYSNCIKENHPTVNITNVAASGATISPLEGSTNHLVTQLGNYKTVVGVTPDIILMDGGGNDMIQRTEIGTGKLDSSYSNGTYNTTCDALEFTLSQIFSVYPTAKLLFIIPHPMVSGGDNTVIPGVPTPDVQRQYWDAIEKVLNKWAVPIADTYRNGNTTSVLTGHSSFFVENDGIHLNEAGYRRVAPVIEDALRKLF